MILYVFLFCEVVFVALENIDTRTIKVVRGQLMEGGKNHQPKLLEKLTIEVYIFGK